jgi:hypothetical protein
MSPLSQLAASAYGLGEYGDVVVTVERRISDVLAPRAELSVAHELVDSDGLVMGLRLGTTDGKRHVYNWGDELLASPDLPSHVQATLRKAS